jgi:3-oxo-5-alpha-steroid 4-dehydrogenase 1
MAAAALAALRSYLPALSHAQACDAFAAVGAATFPLLFFVSAPYGKLHRSGWGPMLGGRTGWFLQEIISPVALLAAFYAAQLSAGGAPGEAATQAPPPSLLAPQPVHVFLALWCVHYAHRAVLYPLQRHMSATTVPVVLTAVAFNLVNGALVGTELAREGAAPRGRFAAWAALASPRCAAGLALCGAGAALNVRSDAALRALRAVPGDRAYHVPRGGLFEYVACPHYLGEMLEWSGFAIATATRSGAVFAFWTVANLAPRAATTRAWYAAKFKEAFPANRKALIPFIF